MFSLLLCLLHPAQSALTSQQTASLPGASQGPGQDATRHAAAVAFVEVTGARKRIADEKEAMLQSGVTEMKKSFPNYNPAFADEWLKRMRTRFNPDDFAAVIVHVYEAHFTTAELEQLTRAQRTVAVGGKATVSSDLQAKLAAENTAINSEIQAGCRQAGTRIGWEVGQQIVTEHPDWTRLPDAPAPQAAPQSPDTPKS